MAEDDTIKTYRIECSPTEAQEVLFVHNCGAFRFAFNYALEKNEKCFSIGERLRTYHDIRNQLSLDLWEEENEWAQNIHKDILSQGVRRCLLAFYNSIKKGYLHRRRSDIGFPKFKTKRDKKQQFVITKSVRIRGGYCSIPKIGWVKLNEKTTLTKSDIVKSAKVIKENGKWFIFFKVKADKTVLANNYKTIGVSIDKNNFISCSNGDVYECPKSVQKYLKGLKRARRALARRKRGSRNSLKAKIRFTKKLCKIENIRKDAFFKATSKIIAENKVIVVAGPHYTNDRGESIIGEQNKGRKLLRLSLDRKAEVTGRVVVPVDPVSSLCNTCSHCGHKFKTGGKSMTIHTCGNCGTENTAGVNEAQNLASIFTVGATGSYAFGDCDMDIPSAVNPFQSSKKESALVEKSPR